MPGRHDTRPNFVSVFIFPVARYSLQLVFAYPLVLLVGYPLDHLLSRFSLDGSGGSNVIFVGPSALSSLYVGFLVGMAVAKLSPRLIPSGTWIWLPPTALVLWSIVPALIRPVGNLGLYGYIYSGSDEGLGLIFATLTTTTLGYSAGMALIRMERTWFRRPRFFVPLVLIVWISTLPWLLLLMRDVQRSMIERDRNIRVIVNSPGGPIALEPKSVCGKLNGGSVLVESGTRIQSLKRFVCSNGELAEVDPATPWKFARDEPFEVEKVRVLEGPHKGLEGWVVSSHVWSPLPLAQ